MDSVAHKILRDGGWLDTHINAAGSLLKKVISSPVFGLTHLFPSGPFIQILYVRKDHWITLDGISSSVVHVYDSMDNYTPSG